MCVVQVGGAGRIGGREIVTVSVGSVERLEGVEMGGGSHEGKGRGGRGRDMRGRGVDGET